MLTDLTLSVTKNHIDKAFANEKMTAFGHLGTHFDVADKSFDIRHAICPAIVFDVSTTCGEIDSLPLCDIFEGDFVIFHTGFIDKTPYGTPQYFSGHPWLSFALIDSLLEKRVRYIGIDAAGIRRGEQHTPTDNYCAKRDVFVIENLCNLKQVLAGRASARFTAYVFPVRFEGLSGLPCRVAAQF
ncbi:MAG: cyclase family protein [Christensenellales bacterium]